MEWAFDPPRPEESEPAASLFGPRASGKTTALQRLITATDESSLIVIPWPWEKNAWSKILGKRPRTAIHTPDSLARWALDRWETSSGKTLIWTSKEKQEGNDPQEQATNLLEEGRMSAGSAHWLLREEIGKMIKAKIFPKTTGLLALDEPDSWDPEASEWIRQIPCDRKIETKRGKGITWHPGKKPYKNRWAKIDDTSSGAGEWIMDLLQMHPNNKNWLLVVQTEKNKWRDYLQARGQTIEIRHSAECEGREWETILIPSLRKQWGGAINGKNWLDLVASRAKKECIIRIGPEGPPSWIPPLESGKNYLIWTP